jgi:uncharacterized membrane protein YcaP (DUF421 family)
MRVLLGLTMPQAAAVVVAAVTIYLVLLGVVRIVGARVVARLGAPDVVLLLVLGAVAGRGILGTSPTLGASVLALIVLLIARASVAVVMATDRGRSLIGPRPLLLVCAGRVVDEHLRRARVRPAELETALRQAGVASAKEVVCAVLEPNGAISVTRFDAGRPLEARLFAAVRGIEEVPARYFS